MTDSRRDDRVRKKAGVVRNRLRSSRLNGSISRAGIGISCHAKRGVIYRCAEIGLRRRSARRSDK